MKEVTPSSLNLKLQIKYMKKSIPVKRNGSWRILRHDGIEVGWFSTRELAQKTINTSFWIL